MRNAQTLTVTADPLAPAGRAERPSAARVPVLDGLRGIAILAVMLYHFQQYGVMDGGSGWEAVYAGVVGLGWTGVNLFFVLSGFLITGILYDSREDAHYYRVFYARRTVRIFPLYYATLAAYFLVIPLVRRHLHAPDLVDLAGTAAQFCTWTYLLNWLIGAKGFTVVSALIQHFWSLSIEEQFYVVWPWIVRNLTRRRLMLLCAGLTAGALALRAMLDLLHRADAAYTWTFCRTDAMAIGALIALAARDAEDWRKLKGYALPATLGSLAGLLAVVAVGRTPYSGGLAMDTLGLLFSTVFFGGFLAIAVNAPPGSRVNRFTAAPVLRFFGKYSYALYVFHQPLAIVLRRAGMTVEHLSRALGGRPAAVVAINGIDFALSIALAFASWHWFEKQFLKLKNLPLLRYRAG